MKGVKGFGLQIVCSKCKRSFNHANYCRHTCLPILLDELTVNTILKLYEEGHSLREMEKSYHRSIIRKVLRGKIRSLSEASKLAHKLKPDSFKLSNKTKDKIRKKRLEYFKNNPEAMTSWRQQSISYPEKLFQQLVEKNELAKKYDIIREYSFFPYFIDFAFVNIKLAVEVDGSQHWSQESKIKRDKEKDQALVNSGWKVYRIPAFKIQKEFENLEHQFLEYLNTLQQQPKQFVFENDIIEYEKIKQQKKQQKELIRQQNYNKKQDLQQQRINKILSSNIDFSTFGWVRQVAKLINISPQKINHWMKKYMSDFFRNRCFRSKASLKNI